MVGGGGVGVLVRHERAGSVVEVERFSHRVMKVKIIIGKVIYQLFLVYTPPVGRSDEEKSEFWEKLEDEVAAISGEEGVIVGGDMKCHIGTMRDGYKSLVVLVIIIIIIIIYNDFLRTPRRGSHVKSDKTHTQSSRYTP